MTALPPISAAGGWKHRDEQDVFAGPPEDPLPPDLQSVYIINAEGGLLYNEKRRGSAAGCPSDVSRPVLFWDQ